MTVSTVAPDGFGDLYIQAAWSLQVVVTDLDSQVSHTFQFSGYFDGTVSENYADISNTFTGSMSQSAVIGGHFYTVQMFSFTPPRPPSNGNPGAISARISAV